MASYKFQLQTNGTGGNIGTAIKLGKDELRSGDPATIGVASPVADDTLRKVVVTCHFFGGPSSGSSWATFEQRRRRVIEYLEAVRVACRFKPVDIRQLARGAAYIPNVHQNFGSLIEVDSTGTDHAILDNCCMLDAQVVDDVGLIGFTLAFTFGRVMDSQWPAGMTGIVTSPTA